MLFAAFSSRLGAYELQDVHWTFARETGCTRTSTAGRFQTHHRFVLAELLGQIVGLNETIERFDQQIEDYCCPFEASVQLLDTIPGIARDTAKIIVSDIGTDMSRVPTANHLAAWAGVAPGNNESAGKQFSGRTRQGNKILGRGEISQIG